MCEISGKFKSQNKKEYEKTATVPFAPGVWEYESVSGQLCGVRVLENQFEVFPITIRSHDVENLALVGDLEAISYIDRLLRPRGISVLHD